MKRAVIFSIPTTTSHGYSWRWQAADAKAESSGQFTYYHDCLADARAHGYDIGPTEAAGENGPGRESSKPACPG